MSVWTAAKLTALAVAAGLIGLVISASFHRPGVRPYITVPVHLADGSVLNAGAYEVSYAEWLDCYQDGGCTWLPRAGMTPLPERLPVVGVNAFDVAKYIQWINRRTGSRYRLPSADEWRIMAASLPRTADVKLFEDLRLAWAADYGSMPAVDLAMKPAGRFGATPAGVFDLSGNVWEWTSTCSAEKFAVTNCPAYRVEGAHETTLSIFIRNPVEGGCAVGAPPAHIGFRLVRDGV